MSGASGRDDGVVLTTRQLSAWLRVDPQSVRAWIARDLLRARRAPDGDFRIRLADVQAQVLKQPLTPADAVLAVREVATRVIVTERTVRKWIDAGILPAMRLPSGEFRIQEDHLTRVLT